MIYRRFGRTNLQIPVFSCGGMRYQFKWQDMPLDQIPDENQQNLEATIRRAIDVGINHIETARGYGCSERQLGVILSKIPRQSIIVQTKIGPSDDPDKFTKEFEESLGRLQLQYVDLLAIHGANDEQTMEQAIRPHGCLAAARKIQQRRLARHIGFSTHAPLPIILKGIMCDRDGGFDYINLHWYYIFQRNWPAIDEATRRDMGVFIISPSDKGGKLYEPSDKLVKLCRPLHPIVFNDLFCLAHSQVHTLSIGAAKPTDFDRHLETLPLFEKAEEVLSPILRRLGDAFATSVDPDLANPFSLGLPEWQHTPDNVNLPVILWLANLIAAFDMTEYAKMRYNMLGNGGHWFPGKNAATLDEPAIRAAVNGIANSDKVIATLKSVHEMIGGESVKRLSESK